MTVLVTGAAGFIGYHLSRRLLEQGAKVVGFDNVNPYYDPALKRARIAQLEATAERTGSMFQLIEADLDDRAAVEAAFAEHKPQKVVNLAAQALTALDAVRSVEQSGGLRCTALCRCGEGPPRENRQKEGKEGAEA